jgi:hypothetical protein
VDNDQPVEVEVAESQPTDPVCDSQPLHATVGPAGACTIALAGVVSSIARLRFTTKDCAFFSVFTGPVEAGDGGCCVAAAIPTARRRGVAAFGAMHTTPYSTGGKADVMAPC